ncbi:hypothetical protein LSH36_120g03053 [Paralvinella palmiformis]|uniref:IRS-type PTB domain-containing protein n=1 Tax=Paralvinella palmiformis TaxID=53620 RepID=A0AAD9NBI4_9ANNE|nr:hypothetical protein LSH36_120g03053 [Paralvinella palmiformis]
MLERCVMDGSELEILHLDSMSFSTDRLHISLYKSARDRYHHGQEKINIPLDNFYGIASELQLDHEQHVMAIICQKETILLAFQNSETLLAWVLTVRKQLGEEHQFEVEVIKAPPLSRLFQVHYTLYIQCTNLCLISGVPPKIQASWLLCDIKKFGIIENKFCFEAGKRCEKFAGLYVLLSDKLHDIYQILQSASASSRSSSCYGSRASLYSSHSIVSDLHSASLPRGAHHLDFTKCDHNHITEPRITGVHGLVRCATVSEADCKRPSGRVHVEVVAQSTPNVQHESSHSAAIVNSLRKNITGSEKTEECIEKKSPVGSSSRNCDKDCDILKSRRYSSGDIYLSKTRRHWQSSHARSQKGAFGATAAALQQIRASSQESSESQRSHSQIDVTDFCAKVQRTLDILSPKLSKPGDWKGIGVQSTDSVQTGSSSCGLDLESHGQSSQGYTSNSSLNLSEILQSCSLFSSEDKLSEAVSDTAADVKYLKSLSSGSSSTSTRELFETPTVSCSIGSFGDVDAGRNLRCRHTRHARKQRRCRNCYLSNSVANLSATSLASPTRDNPVVLHSFSWTQLNRCPSDASLNDAGCSRLMPCDGEACPIRTNGSINAPLKNMQRISSNGHVINGVSSTPDTNPLQPLRYIDLSQYDGIDDGYIDCLRKDAGVTCSPRKEHVEYQNIPSAKKKADVIRKPACGPLPSRKEANMHSTGARSSTSNSIHASLRRPQHKGTLRAYFGWDKQELEQIDDKLAGEYVCLKEDQITPFIPPRPARMPKSSSLENILEREPASLTDSNKYLHTANVLQNKPGCDLSAVVPTRLAAYSKADLLQALSQSKHITDNKLADSLEKLARSSQDPDCLGFSSKNDISPTSKSSLKEAIYMVMASSAAKVEDNAVFCAVELPEKAANGTTLGKARSNSKGSSGSVLPGDDEGYLDMSLGRSPKKQTSGQSIKNNPSPGMLMGKGQVKTSMQHSKSVEDQLDMPYIDMKMKQHQSSADYLVMSPGRTSLSTDNMVLAYQVNNRQADPAVYTRSSTKPFENLIQHKSYTEHKPKDLDDTESVDSGSRLAENSSIGGDKSSSGDDSSSQKSGKSGRKSGSSGKTVSKSPGLFSRLMKRNSIKNKEKSEKAKTNKEKCKLKTSHSSQEFRMLATSQKLKEKRLSMQQGIPIPTQSSSYYNDLAGSVESDSASQSSRSMASSQHSDSPAESGLAMSDWKLGCAVSAPTTQHGMPTKEISRSSSLKVTRLSGQEEYSSCPSDVTQGAMPPALPPKTYRKLVHGKGMLPPTAAPVVRRHSSEDQPTVSANVSYADAALSRYSNIYTNSSVFELQHNGKQHGPDVQEMFASGVHDNGTTSEERPPPLPEKTSKGSKKSLVAIAEMSTMETVPEGSNSAERDNDSSGPTSLAVIDTDDDDDVFLDDAASTPLKSGRNSSKVLPPSEPAVRRRKNPNLTVAIPGTSTECEGHHRGRTAECRHDGSIQGRLFIFLSPSLTHGVPYSAMLVP